MYICIYGNYMTNNVNVVELFAGVGGFRLGLEAASPRYITIWANQWEPGRKSQHAFDCYVKHFGNSPNHSNEDIAIAKNQVPKHDLLVGGFPCQDYSVAATQAKGIQGKKGVLWWEINHILQHQRPPFVLLENVDRLIKSPTAQRGRDFGIILKCFHDLGYAVEWRVVNAADYGFAQKRRRVFIFAYHQSTRHYQATIEHDTLHIMSESGLFGHALPITTKDTDELQSVFFEESHDLVAVSDTFACNFENTGLMRNGRIDTITTYPIKKTPIPLSAILQKDIVDEKYFAFDLSKVEYMKGSKRELRTKPNGEPYFYTEGAIPFPDNLNGPARTILTSEGKMNRSTHYVVDQVTGRVRTLTPVECERINGFPDNWTNTGMPEAYRYFTMGNALVVPLITVMGQRLIKLINAD
jgi:DNA (cytosine-5)-methyltransferase 1